MGQWDIVENWHGSAWGEMGPDIVENYHGLAWVEMGKMGLNVMMGELE